MPEKYMAASVTMTALTTTDRFHSIFQPFAYFFRSARPAARVIARQPEIVGLTDSTVGTWGTVQSDLVYVNCVRRLVNRFVALLSMIMYGVYRMVDGSVSIAG